MSAKTLMIQGTASHVGKSVMTAALCRILRRQGYRVAPFKAQNMSNNSFVTREGGEIGRAQAAQAEACGIEPSVLMNPVLLKPTSDRTAQVIAMGKVVSRVSSIGNMAYRKRFMKVALNALEALRQQYDVVVIEGAGSAAEINLKNHDIVNMSIAQAVKAPVILVGNIDWGGIFAQLVGTFELLSKPERRLVRAFLINKFRGDIKLFKPGIRWIEKRTQKKVLGVIPYIRDLDMAEEDSIASSGDSSGLELRDNRLLDRISGRVRDRRVTSVAQNHLLIDIIWYPRISNFTDFDPLQKQPGVTVRYLHEPDPHHLPDVILMPGSKSTVADLKFLHKSGLAASIQRSAAAGVPVLGICGGYQMLGQKITDPHAVESDEREFKGLGLLPVITKYEKIKTTVQVKAKHHESGRVLKGYEIHMGQTRPVPSFSGGASFCRVLEKDGKKTETEDGFVLKTQRNFGTSWIAGTYIHGLFDEPDFLTYFLNSLRWQRGLTPSIPAAQKRKNSKDVYDRLADIVLRSMDKRYFADLLA